MVRFFGVAVSLITLTAPALAQTPPRLTVPVRAAEVTESAPDRLLSPTAQLYLRWDGIAAHNEAYKKSIWGSVMAGSTGDSIRSMIAKLPKQLGNNLLAEPLLDGKPPQELKATLADLKNASKLIELIADRGVIITAEVREPVPTLKGVGNAIGSLIDGKLPGPEAIVPNLQLLIVVPDVGEKAEVLFAAIRLALKKAELKAEPLAVAGRIGLRLEPVHQAAPIALQAAWWLEGKHFVFYVGNMKPEAVVAELAANPAKGGVTGHPLYLRCQKNPGYEAITRGFVDTARVVTAAKKLAGPFVPGLNQRLDDLGFGNLKAVVFNSGFDGKESRATYDFDLPGERKGLARIIDRAPLALKDLPPLPPDVSRFSALRIDPVAAYDAGVMALETLMINESFGPEEDAKTMSEKLRVRRDYVAKLYDKALGVNIREELLPALGDKVVMFQSPTEGLSVLGTVICVSLKDTARAKAVGDRIQRGLDTLIGSPIKVRKKTLRGVEIRELYCREFGFVTPAYAFVGDWLVVSLQPQGVQGFILRTQGDIPSWTPDAGTAARLAKLPVDACGIQYCDPRSAAQNLCCVGPLFLAAFGLSNRFNETESDFNPIDVGLVPNAHELSKHLFPNLTVARDDGKTIRIEVNESFSLPLEVLGFEPLIVAALIPF